MKKLLKNDLLENIPFYILIIFNFTISLHYISRQFMQFHLYQDVSSRRCYPKCLHRVGR